MRSCTYGSVVISRSGVVGQDLGLPVSGYCAFMPKYVFCGDPTTPWRLHGIIPLCRVIRGYGPLGLDRAVRLSSVREILAPQYGSVIPVYGPWDVLVRVDPRTALVRVLSRGPLDVIDVLSVVRSWGISMADIGLTGSFAGGYWHDKSDVDLVVFDSDAVLRMYHAFRERATTPDRATKVDLGGLVVRPYTDLSWRRTIISGRGVTWIGVPPEPLLHCPPLKAIRTSPRPPRRFVEVEVDIPPGQLSALLYPPCVRAGGLWIVSYEYNVGGILYEGGRIVIRGVAGDGVVYLGLRENPGTLILL
ncbi:MAG: nucleotidyltransferase domain-containing protein [Desulfurococcales archaeon]|nr:nucleotidyltransferase domain-containing protein [Desulfurococcales archaeon]